MSQNKNLIEVHPIPSRILVPTDGSKNSERALNLAISFAKTFDSDLILLTVMPSPRTVVDVAPGGWIPTSIATSNEDKENIARRLLDDAVSECKKKGIRRASSEIIGLLNN